MHRRISPVILATRRVFTAPALKTNAFKQFSVSMIVKQESYDEEPERPRRQRDPKTQVFVSNLNYNTRWETIKDHFSQAGEVQFVYLLKGSEGKSRGMSVITFSNHEEASKALEIMSGTELEGRTIIVKPVNPRPQDQGKE